MKSIFNYWEQKGGSIIRVDKMTNDHLTNTIKMLRNDVLPTIEKNYQDYKIQFNSTNWDCPFPFDSVEDYNSKYLNLEKYAKIMELELESRKKQFKVKCSPDFF